MDQDDGKTRSPKEDVLFLEEIDRGKIEGFTTYFKHRQEHFREIFKMQFTERRAKKIFKIEFGGD